VLANTESGLHAVRSQAAHVSDALPCGANGYSWPSQPLRRGCQSGAASLLSARGTPSVLCSPQPARSLGGHLGPSVPRQLRLSNPLGR
jgi:hypothetical protein